MSPPHNPRFRKNISKGIYLTLLPELLGSFFFTFLAGVLVVGAAKVTGEVLTAQRILTVSLIEGFLYYAITFGVMKLTYQTGGYLNPAFSLGLCIYNMIQSPSQWHLVRTTAYVVMQIVGCIAGAFAVRAAIPYADEGFSNGGASQLALGETSASALGLSIVLTFFLFFTILSVRRTEGRMTSIIFCFIYIVVRMLSYPLYNGYFNPARTLAHAIAAGGTAWNTVWIDMLGSVTGASLAALLFTAWSSGLAKV